MKVDIWIYTDDGGELNKIGLTWAEACAEICSQYILEKLEAELTSDLVKDFIHDEVVEVIDQEYKNESNEN
jgi:hypothetical protein